MNIVGLSINQWLHPPLALMANLFIQARPQGLEKGILGNVSILSD